MGCTRKRLIQFFAGWSEIANEKEGSIFLPHQIEISPDNQPISFGKKGGINIRTPIYVPNLSCIAYLKAIY